MVLKKGLSKKVDKSLETLVKALTPRLMLGCSLLVISDGSGLRFFGLGRARAFPCRARARVGLRPDYEGFFGRARALHFRARVGLGPG